MSSLWGDYHRHNARMSPWVIYLLGMIAGIIIGAAIVALT